MSWFELNWDDCAAIFVWCTLFWIAGTVCGGVTTPDRALSLEGNLTSPIYPCKYPANAHCTWNISANASGGLLLLEALSGQNSLELSTCLSPSPCQLLSLSQICLLFSPNTRTTTAWLELDFPEPPLPSQNDTHKCFCLAWVVVVEHWNLTATSLMCSVSEFLVELIFEVFDLTEEKQNKDEVCSADYVQVQDKKYDDFFCNRVSFQDQRLYNSILQPGHCSNMNPPVCTGVKCTKNLR